MSRATFQALRDELEAQRWNLLDLKAETDLGEHYVRMLRRAAPWAKRFGRTAKWFETDYAALAHPDLVPPGDDIARALATCRRNGELSRFGSVYMDLLLRWTWAEEEIEAGGLPPPYEPLLAIFRAGAGIDGEHGNFRGPGVGSIAVGPPEQYLAAVA